MTTLLKRLGELEEKLVQQAVEITQLKAENTRLKAELIRKDKIIAGLQQRLFGSSSEKLDPAQLQLEMDELLPGKPEPLPEPGGETSAAEEEKPRAKKNRRTKAERFPKNLMILIEKEIIPDEVLADPDAWQQIGEEHHDELDVTKAQIFWRRTVCKKFVHKTEKARPPLIAPAPLPSIPGTLLAPALAGRGADCLLDFLGYARETNTIAYQGGLHTEAATAFTTASPPSTVSATPVASPTPAGNLPISGKPPPKSPSPSCYTSSAFITSKSRPARPPPHPPAAPSSGASAAVPSLKNSIASSSRNAHATSPAAI